MSANILEKVVAMTMIGSSVAFMGYMFFRGPKSQKKDAFKVRQQLLQRTDTKMLYSTMSFFYLQGFKQQELDSFYNLYEILQIETPNLVVLPISQSELSSKYRKMLVHPKFREAMDKFEFNLKNKDEEGLRNMQNLSLKNLQKLYLIDKCSKDRKCKIVCGRRSAEEYKTIQEAYNSIEHTKDLTTDDIKIDDYTENVLKEMKPSVKFSIFPESPYKTIVGVIEPELLHKAADKWKKKFQKAYSHTVIEDEQIIEREERMRNAQNKT